MLMTGSGPMDAERAFRRAARGRRWTAMMRRLRGERGADLPVFDSSDVPSALTQASRGIREIPLDAISGTLEPGKASLFDPGFRPAAGVRARWERLWLAEHRGAVLPPISVVPSGDGYAVLDGHHRVSVAKARGAATIDARIDPAQLAAA
jgi:ParB-like nuclease domain